MRNIFLLFIIVRSITYPVFGQPGYFYPGAGDMNPAIPSPETFLGYPIGSHHTRHDKIVEYLRELDRLSDRISVRVIGETFEHRAQVEAIFTSAANHNRLEEIRKTHLAGQITGNTSNIPLIIHLGYNVHGNEPSSSEAALLTAYYLSASENPETLKWLNEMVILMDPVINPDGRDRHTHWANMHKADPPVADPSDREHNEIWPGGRFNHYWFDLNRDWFLGVFPETRNRIKFFHEWRPYVQTDHHEMGTNSTFYFDPGKMSSNNPIIPDYLYKTIYPAYADYFSEAANRIGSMYYTKETYDKLYPGYGSSYINFYGGAGFLFEQAGSRGHLQETSTIPLSFAFTIRNQFTMSLATVRASLAKKNELLKMRKEFYRVSAEQAKRSPVKTYIFGDSDDETRTRAFVELLLLHEIEVYELPNSITAEGKRFEPGKSFIVPVEQPNYIMVRSVFEKDIPYTDSVFYDASTWSLIHAYNLPYIESKTAVNKGNRILSLPQRVTSLPAKSDYTYIFKATDYYSHKAIYQLQKKGVFVQVAFRPFTALINNKPQEFGYGTLSIPVNLQRISPDSLYTVVKDVASATHISFYGLNTGYNIAGVDLGSGYLRTLKKPEALMLVGPGIAATETGEIWHLLDQRLQMPITKTDILNIGAANLNRYNIIILASGNYTLLTKAVIDRIKSWVQNGGTLITIKTGTEWAIKQEFTKEKLIPAFDTLTPGSFLRSDFDDAVKIEGAKRLGGSIFTVDLDTTHPIGFGFTKRKVSIYRNGLTFLAPSANPYSTAAKYTEKPLVGGYLHPAGLMKVKNSAAIVVAPGGRGRVILFTDDPNFRGTWYGTNKLFLNALFFGTIINIPSVMVNEETHSGD